MKPMNFLIPAGVTTRARIRGLSTNTYNVPDARGGHAAIWSGTEMIVWGGFGTHEHNTGGRYRPATDSWQPTSLIDAPHARQSPEGVWTGTEMITGGVRGKRTRAAATIR